jgi:hypothetical protein
VVALQPSVVRPGGGAGLALLRRAQLVRPSRSPLFSAALHCQARAAAFPLMSCRMPLRIVEFSAKCMRSTYEPFGKQALPETAAECGRGEG